MNAELEMRPTRRGAASFRLYLLERVTISSYPPRRCPDQLSFPFRIKREGRFSACLRVDDWALRPS